MDYNDQYAMHGDFPLLQASTPLTYTLTMKACLSNKYAERPSFAQVLQLLNDVQMEVATGRYMDGTGRVQVRRGVICVKASHDVPISLRTRMSTLGGELQRSTCSRA